MHPNVFETANAGFAQALYEDFLRDPASVSPEWRKLFESGQVGERPAANGNGATASSPVTNGAAQSSTPAATAPAGATLIKGPALRLAQNMNESLTVPTATTFRELAVGTLDARRRDLNAALAAAGKSAKLSFTHLIAYALVQGLKKHPVMGHHLLEKDKETFRVAPDGVFLGLAVDVERKDGSRGLVVPVLKHAEAMDFAAFHAEYERIVEAARTNKLMPDAFAGATVSLTNPGGLGTSASVPRLMKGQGTIIATGAIGVPQAFAADPKRAAELGVGKVMQMTSTYDHRIIQGAESGAFLRTIDLMLQGQEYFYENVAVSLGVTIGGAATQGRSVAAPQSAVPVTQSAGASTPVSADTLTHVAAGMGLVKAHRTHGHLAAQLDPLGATPPGDPALEPTTIGLTPAIMATIPASVLRVAVPGATLAEALPKLRETYCGTIAYEVEHIASHTERVWLREAIETGRYRSALTPDAQKALLQRLTEVETFEKFLHKAYLGQKRFSIEGVDMLVPMLDLSADLAAEQGAREVVIGMAHRGRLNVLVHNVGRAYESIFAKFEGSKHHPEDPDAGTGDVKYHLGAEGTHRTPSGKTVDVSLSPNPSHLEFVGPVVDGRARAKQTSRKGATAQHDTSAAVPIVIHGDAAFAGQGVVAETLNLGSLPGYNTGGTLHIITNNQVGFTTDTVDSRSTRYASDLAKGFDIPIFHVNADDPEACLSAVRLAMAYRTQFKSDVLIDLVGYRRHGHNESDEPAYTQPLMYERIKALPTVRTRYADRLVQQGAVSQADADAQAEGQYQKLVGLQQAMKAAVAQPAGQGAGAPVGQQGPGVAVETALSAELLTALNEELLTWPADFTVHPKLIKQLERRRQVMVPEGGIDYGHAEALAFGSLLLEGVPIRLTGQDSERGTFSHRHLVLNDAKTGAKIAPVQHLKGALAPLEVFNSPLSELATMGFEYGYSVAAPEALVLWEGQFGDFVNGAQVILDQFLSSGLSKWGLRTRLTLLLPHGYEGQGPEHSSARLERFLQLAAEGNIRVANASTPAQYFHLLRRQARDPRVRPLIVMTPKSLLRLPIAASKLADFTSGTFRPVLDDPGADASQVTRVVLCSGKVYYDLMAEAEKLGRGRPAVVRLEQLYPFPEGELKSVLARFPRASQVVWAQEEPRNMGAWNFVYERLTQMLARGMQLRYAGRPERASPAEGDPAAAAEAQRALVADALGVGKNG